MMEKTVALPPGYTMRRPIQDDFAAVADFLVTVTTAERGAPDFPEAELRDHWSAFDLQTDVWLILAPDDSVAGYAALHHGPEPVLQAEAYVHPTHAGRGLGTFLLRATETRAGALVPLAPPDVQVLLYNAVNAHNEDARQLLDRNGYVAVRSFWRMIAALAPPPPPPVWPDGVKVRAWASEADDQPAYLALEEAFQDHWAHVPTSFATWRRKDDNFDPGLWLLAYDGAELAGVLIGRYERDMGWIDQLGVRRPWRGRGLGQALLQQAFAVCASRGWSRVELDVDAESETGATRLYERAGMQVEPGHATIVYRKELRTGREFVATDS